MEMKKPEQHEPLKPFTLLSKPNKNARLGGRELGELG
jgi:hypothetical protein